MRSQLTAQLTALIVLASVVGWSRLFVNHPSLVFLDHCITTTQDMSSAVSLL
jgi:hypothetical protein